MGAEAVSQMPTVGHIVHYHSYGTPGGEYEPEPRAAIVTESNRGDFTEGINPFVSLAVINPTGMHFNQKVPYSAEPKPGHWSWPPRI